MLKKKSDPSLISYREILPQVLDKIRERDWSIKDGLFLYKFPYWMLGRVYSNSSIVVHQGRFTKGYVEYLYIPGDFTVDEVPIIVDVIASLGDAPIGVRRISYAELKSIFKNNKFSS